MRQPRAHETSECTCRKYDFVDSDFDVLEIGLMAVFKEKKVLERPKYIRLKHKVARMMGHGGKHLKFGRMGTCYKVQANLTPCLSKHALLL